MFRHVIPIGRILGISVDLDYSWFLIVGLFTWMLAVSYFPVESPGAGAGQDWAMGFVAAVMLFVCVLVHELGHSVMAQLYGLRVPRITLFLFGGVSQIAAEPGTPGQEFWISAIGPMVSFALAAFFWEIEPLLAPVSPWDGVAACLALMNLVLAIFNLIPGFPLDGGRVLRAILWKTTGSWRKATAAAAITGRFVGFLMIAFGIWQIFRGALIDGLWTAFIGWYLESAAGSQLQMETTRTLIGEHRVGDAMRKDFPRIPGDITLQALVDHFVLSESTRYFVVSGEISGEGLITLSTLRGIARDAWPATTAAQVMMPVARLDTTTPETGLWAALEKMGRDGVNQLPVVEGSAIVGILSREDILHYLRVLETFASGAGKAPERQHGAGPAVAAGKGHTHLP